MILNEYLKTTLTEAAIKAKEVQYGSNINEYNDGKIGLHSASRSYFAVASVGKEGDEAFLLVAISRDTGEVKFTLTQNAYIGRMIHVSSSFRRQNVRMALQYLPQILYLIKEILSKFHARIPAITLIANFNILNRMLQFLIRSPEFRTTLLKYRFKERNIEELDDKKGKRIVYSFKKKSIKGKK